MREERGAETREVSVRLARFVLSLFVLEESDERLPPCLALPRSGTDQEEEEEERNEVKGSEREREREGGRGGVSLQSDGDAPVGTCSSAGLNKFNFFQQLKKSVPCWSCFCLYLGERTSAHRDNTDCTCY